jgi:hypothetical protein
MSMANNFLTLEAAPSELAVIAEARTVCDELYLDTPWHEIETSEAFHAVFPDENSFTELFDDPEFLDLCATIELKDDHVWFAGNQADPRAIANLIQQAAPSALPIGFEWAVTCDPPRPGEFAGGYYVVKADDIVGGSTNWLMREALDA